MSALLVIYVITLLIIETVSIAILNGRGTC